MVHGHGNSGACSGDSGGPLLARDEHGRVRVVGLLDAGHASCVEDDRYTRTDVLASWWTFEGAGSLPVCEGDVVIQCANGEQTRVDCSPCGRVCADWTPTGAANCIEPEAA